MLALLHLFLGTLLLSPLLHAGKTRIQGKQSERIDCPAALVQELQGARNVFGKWYSVIASAQEEARQRAAIAFQPLQKGERGYAYFNTKGFFPPNLMKSMKTILPKRGSFEFMSKGQLHNTFIHDGERNVPEALSGCVLDYARFLNNMINFTLPKEQVELDQITLIIQKGREGVGGGWHIDGGYLAATVTLWGPGTRVAGGIPKSSPEELWKVLPPDKEPNEVLHTDAGETVVFSAAERGSKWKEVAPTPHSPPPPADRALLILRFRLVQRPENPVAPSS